MEDMIPTVEASRLIGRDARNVRIYCERGLIPGAVKIGRNWIVPRAAAERFKPPLRGNPLFRRKSKRQRKAG